MLQMDGRDMKSHHGAEVKLKLGEVGAMTQRHHSRVVWPGAKLGEYHLALLRQEELHAPKTVTSERLGHLVGHVLRLREGLIAYMERHPALTIVAALLHVAYRRAEEGWRVLLGHGKQGELRIKVYEFLYYHLLHVATTLLHGIAKSLLQLVIVVYVALSMARRRHQRLYHTGEAYLVSGTFELVESLGIEILGRAQAQLLGGEVAYGAAVHGVVYRTR